MILTPLLYTSLFKIKTEKNRDEKINDAFLFLSICELKKIKLRKKGTGEGKGKITRNIRVKQKRNKMEDIITRAKST